ncbi:hypothetical protein [Roseiarcus sp.]|uniref:hypothetical protein n=1 Tax=Roseiarcus sp. TaxID=1969460 RepID=UPI003F94C07E
MSQRLSQTIDELLGDSLIQAVMRADNVEPLALRTMLADVAGRIAAPRADSESKSANVVFARPAIDRRGPSRGALQPARLRPPAVLGPCGSALCG